MEGNHLLYLLDNTASCTITAALGLEEACCHVVMFSYCFSQNGNTENPYCNGIPGILEAYHQSLKTVQLYGPTNFAPVVNHVARYKLNMSARTHQNTVVRSYNNRQQADVLSKLLRQ